MICHFHDNHWYGGYESAVRNKFPKRYDQETTTFRYNPTISHDHLYQISHVTQIIGEMYIFWQMSKKIMAESQPILI